MAFHVSLVGRSDLSGEIYHQIRPAILEGRLKPGERLSPTRELATALTVSRSTVTAAYENLLAARIAEGLSRLRRCFDERLPPRLKAA